MVVQIPKLRKYSKRGVHVIRKSGAAKSNYSQVHFVFFKMATLHSFSMVSFKCVSIKGIRLN